jgi:hypothetical protein
MNSSIKFLFNEIYVDGLLFDLIFCITAYGLFNFLKKIQKISRYETERVNGTGYFEGHFKVLEINTPEKWRKFAEICRKCDWSERKIAVPLLSNYDSRKGPYPVITLRMYDTDMYSFLIEFNKFRDYIQSLGYTIEHPHVEVSHDDEDPLTDLYWAIFPIEQNSLEKYKNGAPFLQCFRWAIPEDITDDACNPPEGWFEQVKAFENISE